MGTCIDMGRGTGADIYPRGGGRGPIPRPRPVDIPTRESHINNKKSMLMIEELENCSGK